MQKKNEQIINRSSVWNSQCNFSCYRWQPFWPTVKDKLTLMLLIIFLSQWAVTLLIRTPMCGTPTWTNLSSINWKKLKVNWEFLILLLKIQIYKGTRMDDFLPTVGLTTCSIRRPVVTSRLWTIWTELGRLKLTTSSHTEVMITLIGRAISLHVHPPSTWFAKEVIYFKAANRLKPFCLLKALPIMAMLM